MTDNLRDANTTTPEIRYVPLSPWGTVVDEVLADYADLWRRLADAGLDAGPAITRDEVDTMLREGENNAPDCDNLS